MLKEFLTHRTNCIFYTKEKEKNIALHSFSYNPNVPTFIFPGNQISNKIDLVIILQAAIRSDRIDLKIIICYI